MNRSQLHPQGLRGPAKTKGGPGGGGRKGGMAGKRANLQDQGFFYCLMHFFGKCFNEFDRRFILIL